MKARSLTQTSVRLTWLSFVEARFMARDDEIELRLQAFRGRQKFGALFVIGGGRKRT
jgi:hypothetical protein